MARSTSSVKSAKGKLWAPLGAVKAIRPAAARIAASFSPSARQIAAAVGGVYWVETPELPPIADDAWVSPLGVTPPMVPTQPVVALVGIDEPEGV